MNEVVLAGSAAGAAGASSAERIHSLSPASGWTVLLIDDLHGWREWERLESRLRGRGDDGDAAAIRREIAELYKTLELQVRLIVSWAVRSRPDTDDETVAEGEHLNRRL